MKTPLALVTIAMLLQGCGSDTQKTNTPGTQNPTTDASKDGTTGTGTAATTAALADDTELAGQSVSAQVDEGISSLVEENEADATATALTGATKDGEIIRFRDCVAQDGKAVVTIKNSVTRDWTFENSARKATTDFARYRELTRTWSKTGGTVACSDNKKFAQVPLRQMEGVALDVSYKREYSRGASLTKKNKTTISRSVSLKADGTRAVAWTKVDDTGGVLTLEKTVDTSGTRTLDAKNLKGELTSLVETISSKVADGGEPLAISVERDSGTLAFKSRTIKSGKIVAKHGDDGRVETVFADVKYTADGKCDAVSGKITGSIFAKDATTAAVTYTIDFDADGDGATLKFSNGKEFDYAPDGCDLDDPSDVTEKDKADDVAKPAAATVPAAS